MRPCGLRVAWLVLAALAMPAAAAAQGNFEIQVYGSDTVPAGATMVELHSNVTLQGTTSKEDGVLPTDHAVHETLEITHGWTSWFETGLYVFTSVQSDGSYWWVGDHIRPRVRVPESWDLPVGLSLSVEVGYQRPSFSTDTWTLELRPIIDKQLGPWYLSFNPVLDRSLKGEGVKEGRGFEFSPNAKIGYEITKTVSAGVEYYGAIGPVSAFDPLSRQQHMIFPVVDLDLGARWEFNAGVGFGLTPSTDSYIIKVILGYRFGGPAKD